MAFHIGYHGPKLIAGQIRQRSARTLKSNGVVSYGLAKLSGLNLNGSPQRYLNSGRDKKSLFDGPRPLLNRSFSFLWTKRNLAHA